MKERPECDNEGGEWSSMNVSTSVLPWNLAEGRMSPSSWAEG